MLFGIGCGNGSIHVESRRCGNRHDLKIGILEKVIEILITPASMLFSESLRSSRNRIEPCNQAGVVHVLYRLRMELGDHSQSYDAKSF